MSQYRQEQARQLESQATLRQVWLTCGCGGQPITEPCCNDPSCGYCQGTGQRPSVCTCGGAGGWYVSQAGY